MPFAILDKKESLDAFIRRTYGYSSDAERRRVQDALLRANPALKGNDQRPATTVVVLPDVPGVPVTDAGPATLVRALAEAVRGVTPQLRAVLTGRIEQQQSRTKIELADLKQTALKQMSSKDGELRKQLAAISKRIGDREQELKAREKAHLEAVTALEADLDALLSRGAAT